MSFILRFSFTSLYVADRAWTMYPIGHREFMFLVVQSARCLFTQSWSCTDEMW